MTIKPALALIAYALLMLAAGFLVEQRSGLYFLPIVIEDYVSYWGTVHNPDTAPSSMPIYYHKECWPQPMEEARHD